MKLSTHLNKKSTLATELFVLLSDQFQLLIQNVWYRARVWEGMKNSSNEFYKNDVCFMICQELKIYNTKWTKCDDLCGSIVIIVISWHEWSKLCVVTLHFVKIVFCSYILSSHFSFISKVAWYEVKWWRSHVLPSQSASTSSSVLVLSDEDMQIWQKHQNRRSDEICICRQLSGANEMWVKRLWGWRNKYLLEKGSILCLSR